MKKMANVVLLLTLVVLSWQVSANPVACFKTNEGDFCLELFEYRAPITVDNFLSYIENSAYIGSIFHRSIPNFVLQGGGFKTIDSEGGNISLIEIAKMPPIVNEFGLSNTRGTVAMAKIEGNPDSATNQWFVNLADNALNLDNQNGGFTVFGQVIYDGMATVDSIADLPIVNFGGVLGETPTRNFDGQTVTAENFIRVEDITVTHSVGIFDKGVLTFTVQVDDSLFSVRLDLVATDPSIVFQLDATRIVPLQVDQVTENVAKFSSQNGILSISSVMINDSTFVNNVVLKLTNAGTFEFTLQSLEQ